MTLVYSAAVTAQESPDARPPNVCYDQIRCESGDTCAPTVDEIKRQGLHCVRGDVVIANTAFETLEFLSGIAFIGGDMVIDENESLDKLLTTPSLETVKGVLVIRENPQLSFLDGFQHLRRIGGSVELTGNSALRDLGGFTALQTIGGALRIINNDALQNVNGLASLKVIGGGLTIIANDSLENLKGFSSALVLTGPVDIYTNRKLQRLDDLSSLKIASDEIRLCADGRLNFYEGHFESAAFKKAWERCAPGIRAEKWRRLRQRSTPVILSVGPNVARSSVSRHDRRDNGLLTGIEMTVMPTDRLFDWQSIVGGGVFYSRAFAQHAHRFGAFGQLSAGILGGEVGVARIAGDEDRYTALRLGLFTSAFGLPRLKSGKWGVPVVIPYVRWTVDTSGERPAIIDGGVLIKWILGNPIFTFAWM